MKEQPHGCIDTGGGIICCDHVSPPTDEYECMEAVQSQGKACKKCDVKNCYRRGWEKWRVDADNAKRCRGTLK